MSDGEGPGARGASLPARVVFFGSGSFAVPILEALLGLSEVEVVGAVTVPDRPVGRHAIPTPTPVATRAARSGLTVLGFASIRTPEALATIAGLRPDLGVLADYGRIVPPALLGLPPRGIVNVHPSLLPRHRGAAPIAAAILAGDPVAGVTAILMDEGLDTGPVLGAESWPLHGDETAPALEARAAAVGARLIARLVPAWLRREVAPVPQAEAGATLTRPLKREDGRLDPARTATELERRVRAFQSWPGTFVETAGGRLAVLEADIVEGGIGDVPGFLVADGDGLALATSEGRLRLAVVRPAGGRPMSGAACRRGAGRSLPGTRVLAPMSEGR